MSAERGTSRHLEYETGVVATKKAALQTQDGVLLWARVFDNIFIERFWGTLKYEDYRTWRKSTRLNFGVSTDVHKWQQHNNGALPLKKPIFVLTMAWRLKESMFKRKVI
jgi:hypothetical protein